MSKHHSELLESWQAAGREGRPYTVYVARWALGPSGTEQNRALTQRYFAPGGGGGKVVGERAILAPPTDELDISNEDNIRHAIDLAEVVGFDETAFVPTGARRSDLDGLARIVESR